jgi:hypothetical protein
MFSRLAQIFRNMKHLGFGYSSRQGAKNATFGQLFFLCGLCVFAGDIPILLVCGMPLGFGGEYSLFIIRHSKMHSPAFPSMRSKFRPVNLVNLPRRQLE